MVTDTSVPGFLKLSILQLADVGSGGQHQLRFVRRPGDGAVVEDVQANLAAMVNAFLHNDVAQSVEYDPSREPNRVTLRLVPGSSSNAERVELYVNARESATRPTDGAFYALQSVRQVALGYSRQYNTPRVAVTDYELVWTYKRLGPDSIEAAICTAGYVQPNEALKYTADAPGATPQLGGLLTAATEPVVLYSHRVAMRRHV